MNTILLTPFQGLFRYYYPHGALPYAVAIALSGHRPTYEEPDFFSVETTPGFIRVVWHIQGDMAYQVNTY